jgi:rhodanese-related sulfurtransferase
MGKRLAMQVGILLGVSIAAGFLSNAVRSSLSWAGSDPQLLGRDVESISISDAAVLQDDPTALFLDVRSARDFEAEHVQGAVSFSADDFGAAYEELRDFLDSDVRVVIYGEETLPAIRGAEFLKARGLHPRVLDGGWRGWRERNLPVEGGPTP